MISSAALQVLVLLFLIIVIVNSNRHRTEPYEDGILAVLFHGIDEQSRQQMDPLNEIRELEDVAETTTVQAVDGPSGWRLVPTAGLQRNA